MESPDTQELLPPQALKEKALHALQAVKIKYPEVLGGTFFGSVATPYHEGYLPEDIDVYLFLDEDRLREKFNPGNSTDKMPKEMSGLSEETRSARLDYYTKQYFLGPKNMFTKETGYLTSVFPTFISSQAITNLINADANEKLGLVDPNNLFDVFLPEIDIGLSETRIKLLQGLKARGEEGEILWHRLATATTEWARAWIPESLVEAEKRYLPGQG